MNVNNVLAEITNKNVRRYLEYVIKSLDRMGIPLHLDGGLSVIGANMAGYFSEEDGIRCFVDPLDYQWVSVIAHEKQHALDCYKQHISWLEYQDMGHSINDIIQQKIKVKNKTKIARLLIHLEHRAESATIRDIKKYSLPINLDYYIRIANLTMWKYIFAINNNGVWVKFSIKVQDQVAKTMPAKLIKRENLIWSKMPVLLKTQFKELSLK